MNEVSNQQVSEEDEIDLIELLKKVYLEKKFILKISLLAALFGVVYALFQPNEFTSSTTFIPQLSSGVKTGGGSLSGLASLAGINIGGTESSPEFPPALYPQVLESTPFKLKLLSSKIITYNQNITVREYFLNKESSINIFTFLQNYIFSLPSKLFSSFTKNSEKSPSSLIYSMSEDDYNLFKKLDSALTLLIHEKEGFITMTFTDENPKVAAQITRIAQTLLQQKIIDFKIKSSKELLDFTLNQYNDKRVDFEILQDERALFVDKNINISSSLYQNKLDRIESELNIVQTVVKQLASQVEQSKLQVNKNTPVFTTIKPVHIPYLRSAPQRSLIVIIFLIFGFVLSCIYIFIKKPALEIIKSIKL